MKKKIYALALAVMMVIVMLTGCMHNDIGVKLNKDGTGSISATLGIEKDFYENLKQMGTDPFEGKETTEYTYEDNTYIAYTEVKEYASYEDMEKALLEMTYETELLEDVQGSMDGDSGEDNSVTEEDDSLVDEGAPVEEPPVEEEPDAPAQDNHIFSEVSIKKEEGLFSSTYSFHAVMNPQSNTDPDNDVNDTFRVTLSVEMPAEVTASTGGKAEGNKVTFDIADITEAKEMSAECQVKNTGALITVAVGAVVVLTVVIICIVKFKKK